MKYQSINKVHLLYWAATAGFYALIAAITVFSACKRGEKKVEQVAVEEIRVNVDNIVLKTGSFIGVVAEIFPANATDTEVTWTTGNAKVVTVNDGTVTAVDYGTTVVTVTSKADAAITVSIPVRVLARHSGPKAVFMGNSITEMWALRPFFAINGYVGKGISGQTVSQMLNRFRNDVIDLDPACAVIMGGTNDLAHNPGYSPTLEGIMDNIAAMAEMAVQHKMQVLLCSVTPADYYGWAPSVGSPAGKIVELNAMIRNYAAQHGMTYVDYHTVLKNEKNILRPEYMASPADPVHLSGAAYDAVEPVIKDAVKTAILE